MESTYPEKLINDLKARIKELEEEVERYERALDDLYDRTGLRAF